MSTPLPPGEVALIFLGLTVLSVGGAGAMLSGAQERLTGLGVLTPAQFTELYGLAAVAPGPNAIFYVALAQQIGGWTGVAVAVACFTAPLGLSAYLVGMAGTAAQRPWVGQLRRGARPAILGLGAFAAVVASEPVRAAGPLLLAGVAVVVLLRTRVNVSLVVLGAAVVGAAVLR